MDPSLVLSDPTAAVDPGNRTTVSVKIHNPSPIVEGYVIDVVGDPAEWALVLPSTVSVFPGESATVEVAFDPPASLYTQAGLVSYGVRVRSQVDGQNASVIEGQLDVGTFRNVTTTLVPASSHGSRSGRHRLDVSNWGNEPISLAVSASDADEKLRFSVDPKVVDVPIGGATAVTIKAKTRDTFMRGSPQRVPFKVAVREAGAAPDDANAWSRELDGAFEQRQMLPTWMIAAAGLAAVVLAAVLWWTNRQEDVQATTREATGSAPLTAPAGFAVEAAGGAGITARWEPVEGAESYQVFWIEPDTQGNPTPTTFQTTEVPGAQNAVEIEEGLEPDTEYCFQVSAVTAAGESPRSTPACATTLAPSLAPAPGGVTVEYATADQTRAEVSWNDSTGGAAEHVILQDGQEVATIQPGLTSARVDLKSGENCFRVFSQQGETASELSDETCIDGPGDENGGTNGTGTTVAGGSDDLGWIAVAFSTPVSDPGAAQRAQTRRDQLVAAGVDAEILNTLDYEALADGPNDDGLLYVYVGGFDSRGEAVAFCEDHAAQLGTGCSYFEPGPAEGG